MTASPYADRTPLRPTDFRSARTAGVFAPPSPAPTDADRIEAERDDLRIQLHRAEAETRSCDRAVRELTAERDRARETTQRCWGIVKAVAAERDEALDTISQAWAALNAAGLQSPTASVADLIRQLAAERDQARDTGYRHFKAGQAASEQHAAEWANLRSFLSQYGEDGRIPVSAIRQALRDGPTRRPPVPPRTARRADR
ncbi:hypothetical protein OOK41_09185 [Micromonospora sp. NBC_01655]|uniref:hypothetical protein n=1 Tax=Micromonospora sp. NBC_01655 TaxID=2975983 RepID=UPI00224F0275|nr:hypothetical protein [Micromonospora sp. NBC_01655]MCX4470479.1 hypothetical protein [Micromonospora sp. NBC_01655]